LSTALESPKITYVTLFADETIHPKYEAALKDFERKLGEHYPMYIGDSEVLSKEGEFDHRSPIDTSIIVGRFQKGTRENLKEAIEEANKSFENWRSLPWEERVKILGRAAELIDERKFEIAAAITYEVGKTRLEALAEAWEAIDAIKYFSRVMHENKGYVKKMGPGGPGEDCTLVCKPYGAWVVISPFNFPFMLANGMASGALITGNTIVMKPTSEAVLPGLMLYKIYRDAGVPPGVVNFVTGPGGNFEKEIVSNPKVAGVAFTGSRDVGMRLFHGFLSEQPYAKPVVMELGSKNPVIVTSRADIGKAVEGVVRAAFGYSGQKCSAASRVYVQRSVKDKFLKSLTEKTKNIKVGDPRERETFMGPVINRRAVETFENAVSEVRREKGANVLVGGKLLSDGSMSKGYYVEPTVISGLPSDHRLFKEELFVPLIVVDEFETLEEALKKANDTDYGLTAGIFSEDISEIRRFFDSIQFGVVYANRRGGATTGAWPGAQSFVAWKGSGATGRGVGGPHYLLNFLREQSQTVVVE
jgi:1-pyrroline-5-carboxylate dehydrogenase